MAGVPYVFASATTSIPLSQLDADFNTPVTIGNTTVGLGNTVTSFGNVTLTNATISGNLTATSITGGTANGVVYLSSGNVVTANPTVLDFDGTNLGLGVTPSASGSGVKSLEIGAVGDGFTDVSNFFSVNSNIWLTTGGAARYGRGGLNGSQYSQFNGNHYWYTYTGNQGAGNAPSTSSQTMTLDNSGTLIVGQTSSIGSGHTLTSTYGVSTYRTSNNSSYGIHSFYSDYGSTQSQRAYFSGNGGLANYSANNSNLSDERVKKDISLAGNYLSKVCAIPVKTFLYKDQQDTLLNLGVIAQDVQAIAPELVCTDGFGITKAEDGSELLSIYETDLMYALMKSIQELSAEVTALKAKVGI